MALLIYPRTFFATTKIKRRVNSQKYTYNFTTGDTAVCTSSAKINPETVICYISNIVLHIEAIQFNTRDYYDVMNILVES